MDTETLKELNEDASRCYRDYDYKNALEKVNKVLASDKTNKPARALKASVLIESWDGSIETQTQIMEAISHLRELMKEDPSNKCGFLANIGNAFYKLAGAQLKINGNKLDNKSMELFLETKDYYNESLGLNEDQPEIWINKGNAVKNLGRYLESIECYDRAILIDNEHYNSWGNRGLCCWLLSDLVTNKDDKKFLYIHAMKYIGIELMLHPDFQISEKMKVYVRDFLEKHKIEIDLKSILKEQLPKKFALVKNDFNIYKTTDLSFKDFFDKFCEKENLFLNVHFDCNNCGCSQLDLIDFSFISPINEFKSEYNFFKRLYNILDDYSTARFLLALAQYRSKDFLFLDKERYEPDYSLNYIHNVELLKESFIKIMNIFDKIAFFLMDYEGLLRKDGKDIEEKNISFWSPNSIFTTTNILEINNYQKDLVAMDSFRIDLEKGEFKNIRVIRDFLVHRYYILHDIVDPELLTYPYAPKKEPLEDLQYHENIENFYKIAKKTFRLMKNMLFSLSFFVQYKENQKKSAISGPIVELSWSYTPIDNEISNGSENEPR